MTSLALLAVLGATITVAALPPGFALVLAIAASFYRLADPQLSLPVGSLGVADIGIYALALSLAANGHIRRLRPNGWRLALVAAATSQLAATLLSIPASVSAPKSLAVAAPAVIRFLVIYGLADWLSAHDAAACLKRLRFSRRWVIRLTAVACALALIPPRVIVIGQELSAPLADGSASRVSGVSGGFLPGLTALGFCIVIAALRYRDQPKRIGVFHAILILTTVLLTLTRGALIDYSVLLLVLYATGLRSGRFTAGRIGVSASAMMLIALAMFRPGTVFRERFAQLETAKYNTLDQRFELWSIAMDMIRARPLLGVGAGNFNEMLEVYGRGLSAEARHLFHYPEHQLLGLAAETGLIGLTTYLLGVLILIKFLLRALNIWQSVALPRTFAAMTFAMYALLIGRLVSELGGTWLSGNDLLTIAIGLSLGLVRAADRENRNAQRDCVHRGLQLLQTDDPPSAAVGRSAI
ncbi:MAG: O-antigen ligase family protein [Roseovarius sp.]|jgi:O-antigen ligase|nr:O-antigen ligase family protein [Roseovarius sp.]